MISAELTAKIRRFFFAEHWKIGTISSQLGVHPDTVRLAIESNRFNRRPKSRSSLAESYIDFIEATLKEHPRLRCTRLFEMIKQRGYAGSVVQLRRIVSELRPIKKEAFLKLQMMPGEQAQMDWAHFGEVTVGRARRRLSCFVMVLSHSRAMWLQFFYDQSLENLLVGHVNAFSDWGGVPRAVIYDNMRSVVLQRIGDAIQFHPRIIELAGHYHFNPKPAAPARGNEKGRVERLIQYVRHSFFAGRRFSSIDDLNNQALHWRKQIAHARPWPDDRSKTVQQAFIEEQPRLLPLPTHHLETDLVKPIRSGKTIYVRFDLNDYSIPPDFVGRPLTLIANYSTIRIVDGSIEIARHQRSYDRGKLISDHAHLDAVLSQKRKALGSTAVARLQQAVPNIAQFLEACLQRGESLGQIAKQLTLLLQDYGAAELNVAINEALTNGTPRISSVTFILNRRHRNRRRRLPVVDLSHHPHLADVTVPEALLEVYDGLNRKRNK